MRRCARGRGAALRPSRLWVRRRALHSNGCLIEWPHGETEQTKYFLSTLPRDTPRKQLVRLVKLRWCIERDYQELKQELGLGPFRGP